jgi:hypothetical protein
MVVTMGLARDCALWRHLGLPRFRALPDGGKTPTSCLLCIILIVVTMLLKLFGLEEEEEDRISPSLRVQTPLYRWGSGYRLGGSSSGCRLLRGHVLSMILWPHFYDHTL